MAALFENSQLIHILSEKYNSTSILPQTLFSISEKYILIFMFTQISHSLYLDANRLFYHT